MVAAPLCPECDQLPLAALLYGPLDRKTNEVFFRSLSRVWAMKNCHLCLFVKGLLIAHYGEDYIRLKLERGYDQKLWLYRNSLDLSIDRRDAKTDIPFCLQIGCVSPVKFHGNPDANFRLEKRMRSDDRNRDWVMPSFYALMDSSESTSSEKPPKQRGRLVDHTKIDWELIKRWDSTCSHNAWSEPSSQQSSDSRANYRSQLRVIDVDKACVTSCPSEAPYVALSYQWGSDQKMKLKKENIHLLESPGFFQSPGGRPAQTIEDTLTVVKQLGYKYAWVDALCIVQDDVENTILNVDLMDQIYRGAHLTIVAAAGTNAYHGLPGVSPTTPRAEKQIRTEIKGLKIASMLETGHGAIGFSRWITRAWTCSQLIELTDQERLLSNRLLTFTDSQVFFDCAQSCSFQEQYHFDPSLTAFYTLADPQANFDFETRDLWEIYASAVAEYTKRTMTDPADKLRAFNGILSFLEEPFGAHFLYGLPSNLFEIALLWKPFGAVKRSALGFPSWSWLTLTRAGWDGLIIYDLVDGLHNACECTVSQATIILPESNTQLTSSTTTPTITPPGWHRHFDDIDLTIHYTNPDAAYSPYRYPRPLPRSPSPRRKLLHKPSPLLRLTSKVATFHLTTQHSLLRDGLTRLKQSCTPESHTLCYLAVLDTQKRTAGTVIVDGDLLPSLAGKNHRFVAIARSTLSRVDDDAAWDDKSNGFHHWTVQREKPKVRHAAGSQVQSQSASTGGEVPKAKFNWTVESDEEDDFAEFEKKFVPPNDNFFDGAYYSDMTFWPAVDVLLLSEEREGVVERLGVGRIHVEAFEGVAKEEVVLLG